MVGREEEANRFLTNLIPEMLHTHGPSASKWFSSRVKLVVKDVVVAVTDKRLFKQDVLERVRIAMTKLLVINERILTFGGSVTVGGHQ